MNYATLGADLNAQFKIVHANGKSVGSGSDKPGGVKRAAAMAKMLANSMKSSQKNDDPAGGDSRKKSVSSLNEAGGRVGSSLITPDSAKVLEDIFNSIDPKEKTAFLSIDVRYVMQILCVMMICISIY